VLDIRSFRGADCDINHYLVVAKFRERPAVSTQTTQKFDMEKINLKKLDEVEGKNSIRLKSQIGSQFWKI
jgi:hypothetical protein